MHVKPYLIVLLAAAGLAVGGCASDAEAPSAGASAPPDVLRATMGAPAPSVADLGGLDGPAPRPRRRAAEATPPTTQRWTLGSGDPLGQYMYDQPVAKTID